METFAYTGRSRAGRPVTGERVASTMDAAVSTLRREDIRVTRIHPVGRKAKTVPDVRARAVKARDLAAFTRQCSVMIGAGLPLVQCLETLGAQAEDRHFGEVILAVRTDIEGGASLANAMKRHPKAFNSLFTSMIEAGEAGGILEIILERLASHVEKTVKLRGRVKSAMTYPVAIIAVATVVVTAILWKVIPTFATLFAGLGADLPLPTRSVIALSNGLVHYGLFLIGGLVAAGLGFRRYYRTPAGRGIVDGIVLKLPLCGVLMRRIAVARFCRTLSTLLASGVSMLDALDITARTAGNAVVEEAIRTTRQSVERGETIARPLRRTAVFPPMAVQMIGVGETTGALPTMLSKAADFYEDEVDVAVAGLLTLLEPLMMALLGVIVGGIVIALYMPIFGLMGALAGR